MPLLARSVRPIDRRRDLKAVAHRSSRRSCRDRSTVEKLASDPRLDPGESVQLQSCVELLLRDCHLPASADASSPERQRCGGGKGWVIAESFPGRQQRRRLGVAGADLGQQPLGRHALVGPPLLICAVVAYLAGDPIGWWSGPWPSLLVPVSTPGGRGAAMLSQVDRRPAVGWVAPFRNRRPNGMPLSLVLRVSIVAPLRQAATSAGLSGRTRPCVLGAGPRSHRAVRPAELTRAHRARCPSGEAHHHESNGSVFLPKLPLLRRPPGQPGRRLQAVPRSPWRSR